VQYDTTTRQRNSDDCVQIMAVLHLVMKNGGRGQSEDFPTEEGSCGYR
jgi:hypothetical protein